MRYFLVVITFVGVWLASQIHTPQTAMFYAQQGLWSLLVIVIILSLHRSKATLLVSVIEIAHIQLNLITCFYYLNDIHHDNLIYLNYPKIQIAFNAIEALILIKGAPYSGLFNWLSELFNTFLYWTTKSGRGSRGE